MVEMEDTLYAETLKRFDDVVSASTALSQGSAGIPALSSRHYWASVLFTRLVGNGVSLLLLLPRNRLTQSVFENWDFVPIASLARNLSECYFAYYYLCEDNVGEEEWHCRWNIFNLHDCLQRKKLFQCLGSNPEELANFEKQADELRDRLQSNSHFKSLPLQVQKDCLKAKKLFLLSQDELLERIGFDATAFRALYILWSSHMHTFPVGFYRTGENDRGRGIENPTEKRYICTAIEVCRAFIRKAAKAHLNFFPKAYQEVSEVGREALFGD